MVVYLIEFYKKNKTIKVKQIQLLNWLKDFLLKLLLTFSYKR